jgi:hypothetical protein
MCGRKRWYDYDPGSCSKACHRLSLEVDLAYLGRGNRWCMTRMG